MKSGLIRLRKIGSIAKRGVSILAQKISSACMTLKAWVKRRHRIVSIGTRKAVRRTSRTSFKSLRFRISALS